MQSIFGALLATGYAAAMTAALAGAPGSASVPSTVTNELTMSYAGATTVAEQYPQYADQITAAAKSSFLAGDDKAYIAGIIAVLIGAVLVFFLFPKRDDERKLLMEYHEQDMAVSNSQAPPQVAPAASVT
jgi:DHA2 family multidrug resistance protein-like MFS transporter